MSCCSCFRLLVFCPVSFHRCCPLPTCSCLFVSTTTPSQNFRSVQEGPKKAPRLSDRNKWAKISSHSRPPCSSRPPAPVFSPAQPSSTTKGRGHWSAPQSILAPSIPLLFSSTLTTTTTPPHSPQSLAPHSTARRRPPTLPAFLALTRSLTHPGPSFARPSPVSEAQQSVAPPKPATAHQPFHLRTRPLSTGR